MQGADGYERECREVLRALDKYEKEARKRLLTQVTTYDTERYTQEELMKLVPGLIPVEIVQRVIPEWPEEGDEL
jgi:hypothetical protein